MLYKTKPYKHQAKALALSKDASTFALLMEQGTGKSKVIVDTVAHLRRKGKVDLVLILAPKGVAPGWIKTQFPDHMPDDVPYSAALWRAASLMSKAREAALAATLAVVDRLRVIVMNIEAFSSDATSDALDFAIEALESSRRAMVVVDESHRIKTPTAHATKRILNLRKKCAYRRILTGTVGDKPFDLYSQFGFLDPAILKLDSFTAFKNEYAEMMPDTSGLMRHIALRLPKKWDGEYWDEERKQPTRERLDRDGVPRKKHMVPAYKPTIVAVNPDGTPKYKNLDKLQALIAPFSYRVLKADCLDLPDKVYSRYYTELTPRQRSLYEDVRRDQRLEIEEGRITTFNKLVAVLKLQQIVCGYVGDEGRLVELFKDWKRNPRVLSLLELLGDRPVGERAIVWCRFVPDILRVSEALREAYGARSVVQFYGAIKDREREEAVARFQGERRFIKRDGSLDHIEPIAEGERARFMVAQHQAGGVGQTWTAATLSIHYSNSFSLIDRLQAEDRPHRIGQNHSVQYIDIEAEGTIDSIIISSLRAKKNVADTINNDPRDTWLD